MHRNENRNGLGYFMGQALATIVALCVAAIVVAFTVKFIFWLL